MPVKRKDLTIILIVAIVAIVLLVLSQVLPKAGKQTNAGALPVRTETPETTTTPPVEATNTASAAPQATASPVPTLAPAEAYLKVQVGNLVFEPIPLTEKRDIDLTQRDGKQNVVRVTKDSIVMHSSNCDNQDCVHQGIVSLENRDRRVLQNLIICLPNQVVLELMDAQEAQADWEAAYGHINTQ
jgi:hypothetical protein